MTPKGKLMTQSVEPARRRERPRFGRLALAGAIAAGALAVVPAAHAADSLVSVRSHVHSADAALHKVVAAASTGSVSAPLAALEAHLQAAGVSSAKLYKHAHTPAVRVKAAAALTKIAAQENRDAQILTPLVGQLSGPNQADLASFIAGITQGREQALTLVTSLLGQLPAGVQTSVAGIVAQLSGAGTGQVGQLAGAISPGSVACPAIDAVSQVVASVLASVQADLGRFQSLLSFLPAAAQTQLQTVVGGLPDQLNSLVASLKQAFNCSSSTAPSTGALTGAAGGPVALAGSLVDSVTAFVQQLLGSFLPSLGGGGSSGTPTPVAVPSAVTGILGQVTSIVPGLTGLFGGSSSGSGFLGGLLGGVPGLGGLGGLGG
jgi:hypothetical protein